MTTTQTHHLESGMIEMVNQEALRQYKFQERMKINQEKIKQQQERAIQINRTRLTQFKQGKKDHNQVKGYEPNYNPTAGYAYTRYFTP